MAGAAKKEKVSAELDALIASSISDKLEHVIYRGWVKKWKTRHEVNARLFVLTTYRVFTIKCGRLGNSVGNQYALIALKRIKASPTTKFARFEFPDNKILQFEQVDKETLLLVVDTYLRATHDWPDELRCAIELRETLPELDDVMTNARGRTLAGNGLVETYLGAAAQDSWSRFNPLVHDAVVSAAAGTTGELVVKFPELGAADAIKSDLMALYVPLSLSSFVVSIKFTGLRPDIVSGLSSVFYTNTIIESVQLIDTFARDGWRDLSDALVANPNTAISTLIICGAIMRDKGLAALVPGLLQLPQLRVLTLDNCSLTDKGAVGLAKSLPRLPVVYLNMSRNKFGDKGSAALATWARSGALAGVGALVLNQSEVVLSRLGEAFARGRGLDRLSQLFLSDVTITDKLAPAAAAAIRSAPALALLSMSGAHMSVSTFCFMTRGFCETQEGTARNLRLTALRLTLSRDDTAPSTVGEAFAAGARSLGCLELDELVIDPAQMCGMLNGLAACQSLGVLSLARVLTCKPKEADALAGALAAALPTMVALQTLLLSGVRRAPIGDAMALIVDAAARLPALRFLSIANQSAAERTLAAAAALLVSAPRLEAMNLYGSVLSMGALEELTTAIPKAQHLRKFAPLADDIEALLRSCAKTDKPRVEQLARVLDERCAALGSRSRATTGATTGGGGGSGGGVGGGGGGSGGAVVSTGGSTHVVAPSHDVGPGLANAEMGPRRSSSTSSSGNAPPALAAHQHEQPPSAVEEPTSEALAVPQAITSFTGSSDDGGFDAQMGSVRNEGPVPPQSTDSAEDQAAARRRRQELRKTKRQTVALDAMFRGSGAVATTDGGEDFWAAVQTKQEDTAAEGEQAAAAATAAVDVQG